MGYSRQDLDSSECKSKSQKHSGCSSGKVTSIMIKLLLVILVLLVSLYSSSAGEVTLHAALDAQIQVSVFVAATLMMFFLIERRYTGKWIFSDRSDTKYSIMHVPFASVIGMLPGCGGAVFIVSSYAKGKLSLAAVVAALTATMGDSMFLLLSQKPKVGIFVMAISFILGCICGWVTDFVHRRRDFLGVYYSTPRDNGSGEAKKESDVIPKIGKVRKRDIIFFVCLIPALILGVKSMCQVEYDPSEGMHMVMTYATYVGIIVSVFVWLFTPLHGVSNSSDHVMTRVCEETSFVAVWVIIAYLVYEYAVLLGLNFDFLHTTVAALVPMIAIFIGFLPGCGPTIIVTTMYLSGLVPFSALMGLSLASDGDALFPAIALTQKAAVVATVYTAVPAIIMAYTLYFFFPDFLNM